MKKVYLLLFFVMTGCAWAAPAQNAIWLIGDGMGIGTMGFFMEGVRHTHLSQYPDQQSTLEKFINSSVTGMYFNNTYDTIVTDSACSATQMAGGALSRPEYVGIDAQKKPLQTLLEEAYQQGKSIGVVTDVYVADATPAGFLAHTDTRKNKYEIARQLVNSSAQVIMGGGLKYFTRRENKDLLAQAEKQGWTIVKDKKELSKVKNGRVLGLFAEDIVPFYGDKQNYPEVPTLLQMTQKAVELLSQNPNGFVLMVEAGKIDWALHENEAGPALWEMVNLDETLAYLWQWSQKQGKTLLYLNADHETGMPAFEYRQLDADAIARKSAQGEVLYDTDTDYVNYPYYQYLFDHTHLLYYVYADFKKLPIKQQTAKNLQKMCDKALGRPTDLRLNGKIPTRKELVMHLNQAQGLSWATKNHSSGMLAGFANGIGAENFSGIYHNTELKEKFEKALGFEQK